MASSSQAIAVPSDDLCCYHCLAAYIRGSTADFSRESAMSVKTDICRLLCNMGFQEEAARIQAPASAGCPEEPAFLAGAMLIAGKMEVVTMEHVVLPYGDGPCKLRIRNVISYDGAGHGSPHFEILFMQPLGAPDRHGGHAQRCDVGASEHLGPTAWQKKRRGNV